MNRALRPTTDEERAEQIAQDKILMFREGWPDMHQINEPDHLPGEWPPGSAVGFLLAGIVGALICGALGFVAYNVGAL
jgi:hypothetical protein